MPITGLLLRGDLRSDRPPAAGVHWHQWFGEHGVDTLWACDRDVSVRRRPTYLMERVSRYLEEQDVPVSRAQVEPKSKATVNTWAQPWTGSPSKTSQPRRPASEALVSSRRSRRSGTANSRDLAHDLAHALGGNLAQRPRPQRCAQPCGNYDLAQPRPTPPNDLASRPRPTRRPPYGGEVAWARSNGQRWQ
jgi:hypothetical protein